MVIMIVIINVSLLVMVVMMMVCVVKLHSQMMNGIEAYTIASINHFNSSVNVNQNILCNQKLNASSLYCAIFMAVIQKP
jgi:hypothetical protein